jgi:hypothetical protein
MNAETLRKLNESGFESTRNFSFPHDLIDDPSLCLSEKRAILAEWASDACAIESFPTLRLLPGTTFPVTLSSIIDALVRLDDGSERKDSCVVTRLRPSYRQMSRLQGRRQNENSVAYQFARDREFTTANAQHASVQAN